jgi:hypothetical protein
MESPPFGVSDVVPLIIENKIDHGPLRESRGLVQKKPSVFDSCS